VEKFKMNNNPLCLRLIVSAPLLILIALTACTTPAILPAPASSEASVPASTAAPQANLPNPASVYCEQQGYRLEIRTAADGSQSGVCIFSDGSECDEWAYFRGECQPGAVQSTPVLSEPTPAAPDELASDGCKIYRDTELGYSFHYPADASLVSNDDPLHGLTIVGPVKDNVAWPAISISHPRDREEYRPPENADLLQWLTDHYLVGDERAPDVQIAGTTAIHFRHERSPQSYAYDRYYFVKSGQLYMIVIGHDGDQEDWDFYNHFLESIQFEQTTAIPALPIANGD
jgi:putative hemolysin